MKTTGDWKGVNIIEEAREFGWSLSGGDYTTRTWKGTQAEIQALLSDLRAFGYSYTVKQGPMWEVTAKVGNELDSNDDPVDETPTTTFEVAKTNTVTDVLTGLNPLTLQLTPQMVSSVKKAIDSDSGTSFCNSWAQPYKDTALILFWTYKSGAKEFVQTNTVLRKSYTVSNKYQVNETIDGVNKIYSKSGMISVENIPIEIQGILPDSYTYTTTDANVPYVAGYMYSAPSYVKTGNTTYSVSAEYTFGVWPVSLYGTFYR